MLVMLVGQWKIYDLVFIMLTKLMLVTKNTKPRVPKRISL